MRIDLNADVGESFGAYRLGDDPVLFGAITSASVACGFHAGDPSVIRQTLRLAGRRGVAVGAHPGFPDLVGFGRREIGASPGEIEDLVLYQVAALAGMAHAEGLRLQHVKPHGALYNMAARDAAVASAVARAVAQFDPALRLFGPPESALTHAARAEGLIPVAEGFGDRAYDPSGALVARRHPESVLEDPDRVLAQAVRMIKEGVVVAVDSSRLPLRVDTICLHGDNPRAAAIAPLLRRGLEAAGIVVAPVGRP